MEVGYGGANIKDKCFYRLVMAFNRKVVQNQMHRTLLCIRFSSVTRYKDD